jgi:hypothetical protein
MSTKIQHVRVVGNDGAGRDGQLVQLCTQHSQEWGWRYTDEIPTDPDGLCAI